MPGFLFFILLWSALRASGESAVVVALIAIVIVVAFIVLGLVLFVGWCVAAGLVFFEVGSL